MCMLRGVHGTSDGLMRRFELGRLLTGFGYGVLLQDARRRARGKTEQAAQVRAGAGDRGRADSIKNSRRHHPEMGGWERGQYAARSALEIFSPGLSRVKSTSHQVYLVPARCHVSICSQTFDFV